MAEPTDEEIAMDLASSIIHATAGDPKRANEAAHLIASALRSARLAERERQWQPIETAPTNTSILVWVPRYEHYGPGVVKAILVDMGTGRRWHSTGWHVGRDIPDEDAPTRWRPLPTPPAAIRETDSDA